MANPSLQIGNDNWAIKEDNLLGYSTAGTRFVPQPITMTRATLGTRVNPSGLVEDVALLGSEEVVNGDFATDSDWIKGTGWSIANGVASCDGTQTGNSSLSQSSALPSASGKTYKITFTISNYVSGGVEVYPTNTTVGTYTKKTANGTYTRYVTVTSATPNDILYIQADSSFVGSIDNVSVKEATIDNLPRVDYTDGTSSLLVEPQRTNLLTYSEDFSDSSWYQGNTSVIANDVISPDGSLTADKVTFNAVPNANIQRTAATTVTSGIDYTFSFYAKSDSSVSNVNINMGTGDESILVTNEWQRFTKTVSSTGTTIATTLVTRNSVSSYIYIWGAQLEEFYPTSYIKTSGSTVTRNQETYTKTGISNLINSEEGVLFVEMAALADDSTDRRITMSDGTTQNRMAIGFDNASNKIKYFLISSNTAQVNKDISVSNITEFNKIAFKYKLNDFALWVNGVEVDTDTSGSTFSANTLSILRFAGYSGTSQNFFGKVKQLQVFKTALSDSELATLTT